MAGRQAGRQPSWGASGAPQGRLRGGGHPAVIDPDEASAIAGELWAGSVQRLTGAAVEESAHRQGPDWWAGKLGANQAGAHAKLPTSGQAGKAERRAKMGRRCGHASLQARVQYTPALSLGRDLVWGHWPAVWAADEEELLADLRSRFTHDARPRVKLPGPDWWAGCASSKLCKKQSQWIGVRQLQRLRHIININNILS